MSLIDIILLIFNKINFQLQNSEFDTKLLIACRQFSLIDLFEHTVMMEVDIMFFVNGA